MFGLMKNKGCMSSSQPDWYRLHYCGTCKSIGSTYGQKSRMMLNYDAVFLAEILSLIGSSQPEWNDEIKSYKCFDLPERKDIPISVQYASDVNILLAQLKFEDNISDDIPQIWNLANRFFRKPFSKLEKQLTGWNIDFEEIKGWLKEGFDREEEGQLSNVSIEEDLSFYGASTAQITAYLFGMGAIAVNAEKERESLSKLGHHFGELVFAMDAWKDVEEDEELDKFNPLLSKHSSIIDNKRIAREFIWKKAETIEGLLDTMSLEKEVLDALKSRLFLNVSAALNEQSTSCSNHSTGIEQSTLPQFARKTNSILKGISKWTNPAIPAKFAATYITFILVFFHQQISSAAVIIHTEPMTTGIGSALFLLGLGILPLIAYRLATNPGERPKKAKRLKKRLERKQRRLKRRLLKVAKKQKEGRKLKWWEWMLLSFAALFALFLIGGLIAAIVSCSGGSCSGGGGACSNAGCCDGDGCCGDCGDGCNCDCN